jgi:hypothetical protein
VAPRPQRAPEPIEEGTERQAISSESVPAFEGVDEAERAILQRARPNEVREILVANDGDEELVDVVNQATEDNKDWIDPRFDQDAERARTVTTKNPHLAVKFFDVR